LNTGIAFAYKMSFPVQAGSFLESWMATGTGCPNEPSKGELGEFLPKEELLQETSSLTTERKTFEYQIRLPALRLSGPAPTGKEVKSLAFGRECSLRMAFAPPAGFHLSHVRLQSAFSVRKMPGFSTWALFDLLVGNQSVVQRRFDFSDKETLSRLTQEVLLMPDSRAQENLADSRCGQKRLIGVDFILGAQRNSLMNAFEMSLEKKTESKHMAELLVEFRKCT
jgi:hypothetical protein